MDFRIVWLDIEFVLYFLEDPSEVLAIGIRVENHFHENGPKLYFEFLAFFRCVQIEFDFFPFDVVLFESVDRNVVAVIYHTEKDHIVHRSRRFVCGLSDAHFEGPIAFASIVHSSEVENVVFFQLHSRFVVDIHFIQYQSDNFLGGIAELQFHEGLKKEMANVNIFVFVQDSFNFEQIVTKTKVNDLQI